MVLLCHQRLLCSFCFVYPGWRNRPYRRTCPGEVCRKPDRDGRSVAFLSLVHYAAAYSRVGNREMDSQHRRNRRVAQSFGSFRSRDYCDGPDGSACHSVPLERSVGSVLHFRRFPFLPLQSTRLSDLNWVLRWVKKSEAL